MISSLAERTYKIDNPRPRRAKDTSSKKNHKTRQCNATIVLDGGGGGGGVGGPASPDEWEPEEEWLRNYMRNVKMHRG